MTEDIFGPVATFQAFETKEDVVALARPPTCGLCAELFTRDLSRTLRLTRCLEAGTVWVNRNGHSSDHILPTRSWKAPGLGKNLGREPLQRTAGRSGS